MPAVYFLFLLRSAWESKEAIFSLILVISKCWSTTLWCSRHWTFKAPALNKGGLADANENIHLIPLAISQLHEELFSSYSFKSLNTGVYDRLSRVVYCQQRKQDRLENSAWNRCLCRGNPPFSSSLKKWCLLVVWAKPQKGAQMIVTSIFFGKLFFVPGTYLCLTPLIIFRISECSWNQAGVQRNFPWECFTAFSEVADLALTASDNLVLCFFSQLEIQ